MQGCHSKSCRSREAPRVRLEQAGERQPCVRATQKRHPLHNNLCIVCLPGARQLSKKGCSEERDSSLMSLSNWRAPGARQPYESRTKGTKVRAPLLGVSAVLANLVALFFGHGFARGHVLVGWGMRVDARHVKVHCAAEHVDLAVGEKVRQVLLHHMGSAVVAAGKAAK